MGHRGRSPDGVNTPQGPKRDYRLGPCGVHHPPADQNRLGVLALNRVGQARVVLPPDGQDLVSLGQPAPQDLDRLAGQVRVDLDLCGLAVRVSLNQYPLHSVSIADFVSVRRPGL